MFDGCSAQSGSSCPGEVTLSLAVHCTWSRLSPLINHVTPWVVLSTPALGISPVSDAPQWNTVKASLLFSYLFSFSADIEQKRDESWSNCINAKGKRFIIQGQRTGEAGPASAASSSCRETIWMLLCCLIGVPASRTVFSIPTAFEVLCSTQPDPNSISFPEKRLLYLLSP